MQKPPVTLHSYADPIFEAYYSKLEQDQLTIAEEQARTDGLNNKPTNYHPHKVTIIKPLGSIIQKALDYNYSLHSPISNIAVGKNRHDAATQKITALEKDMHATHKAMALGKNDLKALKPHKRFFPKKLKYGIACAFGLVEGGFILNILLETDTPLLFSVLIALATAVIAAIGLKLAADWIKRAITILQRRMRYAIVVVLGLASSFAMGVWRATMFNEISVANSQLDANAVNPAPSAIPAWPFITISLVTFLTALAFQLRYWQSDKEKAAIEKYEEKVKEIAALQKEHDELELKIDRIKKETTVQSGTIMQKQEYAASNERRLVALASHVLSHYESVNMDFRTDNQCPPFFGEKVDFNFTLYFTTLFKNLK